MLSVWWFGQAGKWRRLLQSKGEGKSKTGEREKQQQKKREKGKSKEGSEAKNASSKYAERNDRRSETPSSDVGRNNCAGEWFSETDARSKHTTSPESGWDQGRCPTGLQRGCLSLIQGGFFFEPKDEGKKNKTFIEEDIKAAKMLIEENGVIQLDTGILIRKKIASARVEPNRAQRTLVFLGVLWPKPNKWCL